IALRAQKKEIIGRQLLNSWQRMMDYCHMAMAHEVTEQFRLLFLDRRNYLLAEEVQQRGTIDHTPVYPREIVKRALEIGAGALVLAHNHPSGDTTPSKDDIAMTRAIIEACKPLGIVVHDHVVIGKDGMTSFKNLGLI
ncbi:MAG: DNA repair protein RadC, partial [Alphaproteobacteria bacterium]|nr:DNA repair protein RadC [Alphaproteobacteria bacterium]